MDNKSPHRAGFVALVGRPNAGKSSLLNALVGEDLAIITPRAQTTRHRIKGILNGPGYQAVFSDTPGILEPAYAMHEKMMDVVSEACGDSDVIVYIIDAGNPEQQLMLPEDTNEKKFHLVIALNKIDLTNQQSLEALAVKLKQNHPDASVVPVSAEHHFNLHGLLEAITEALPESPPYYSEDELTDRNERFFVAELIREQILLNYREEIPYSVEVEVGTFRDKETLAEIYATVYVMRESQKAILLGHQGHAIKRTVTRARVKMEKFLDKKVFLDVTIKVNDNWRNDVKKLKRFGYGGR